MNQKAKNITAAVLLTCGIGIWVPQLMGAGSPEKAMNTGEAPAVGTLPSGSAFVDGMEPKSRREVAEPAPGAREGETAAEDSEPRSSKSNKAMDALDQLLGGSKPTRKLQDLGELWREEDAASAEPNGQDRPLRLTDKADDYGHDELDAFLEANPLTAVLVGEDSALASFGSYLMRSGDRFLGQAVRVTRVAPRFVELEYRGDLVRVELPPFRSRAADLSETPADRHRTNAPEAMPSATPSGSAGALDEVPGQ